MGYALSEAIERARRGGSHSVSTKKLIDDALAAASRGAVNPYEVTVKDGRLSLKVDGAEDHALAMDALERIGMLSDFGIFPRREEPAAAAAPSEPASTGPGLHASIDRFLKDFASKDRAAATVLETRHTLELFRDLTDDVPLARFGVEHLDAFRDALSAWPARARVLPDFKGLSARAIIDKARTMDAPRLNVRTIDKHLDRLRVFFNALVQRGELDRNPLSGFRLQTSADKYEPARRGFTRGELAVLFDPTRRAASAGDDPMFFWLPVLMLFTGARMNELVYLDVEDLADIEGVWGLHITKHLKNAQSRRFVPLPQRVLDMGLREYAADIAAAGFSELFPGGSDTAKNGRGDKVSKWFNRTYLRNACGIDDPEVCFQSFRNTLSTAADYCGISEAQMNPILGHGARTIQQKHYIDLASLPERQGRIEKLAGYLMTGSMAPYQAGQFSGYFDGLARVRQHRDASARRAERHADAKDS